jgi:putative transposase
LCLTHAIFDKDEWLLKHNLKNSEWPIWRKPKCIYVDNGKEFHSEALQRGCEVHGIKIEHRPLKCPHYGGIVERVIGTFMELTHQLPGTIFSNIKQRGVYNLEKKASFTLLELEHWLTITIVDYYHKKLHSSINMAPIEKYKLGILGDGKTKGCGYPSRIYIKEKFLIDFLPIEKRTIQRFGFILDKIIYYTSSLNVFISNRKNKKNLSLGVTLEI